MSKTFRVIYSDARTLSAFFVVDKSSYVNYALLNLSTQEYKFNYWAWCLQRDQAPAGDMVESCVLVYMALVESRKPKSMFFN